MIDVNALQRKKAAAVEGARSIITTAETRDDTNLTTDERSKFEGFQKDAENLEAEISRATFLNTQELRDDPLQGGGGEDPEDPEELRSFGAFIGAVARGNTQNLEQREMSMGQGSKGGFLVPREFDKEIRAMQPADGVVRPNAMVIPAGENPDAPIDLPSLDQTGDKGVHGGIQMNWTGETGTKEEAGSPSFILVSLEPENITGYIDVTNKLLNNTTAFASYIQQLMAGAIVGAEESAFYNGDGNGKPLGLLKSDAVIKIKRETANQITYEDLVNINAVIKGTNLKWVLNRSALPQLQKMVAKNTNQLVWQPGAVAGAPDSILGIPVEYNEYSPVLGTYGDIALLDLKKYAIKDGTGLSIFIDSTTQYGSGKTRIYMSWNVDGQSLMKDSILSEDKKTRRSPFVVLN
ncbi:MAG: phage major capsid protein [Candidatus Hodarchaeales archaeon]